MRQFSDIWNDIKTNIYNDKNSLIFLFGDKYYGKTEMLKYFIEQDKNTYKCLLESDSYKSQCSLIRICFLKLLTSLYIEGETNFLDLLKEKLNKKIKLEYKLKLHRAKKSMKEVYIILLKVLCNYSLSDLYQLLVSLLPNGAIANFYIECYYQAFDGVSNDIEFMKNLKDKKICLNFIIATRPYSKDINNYIKKISGADNFESIIKKLKPKKYKIVQKEKYYRMPIYEKLLKEIDVSENSDTEIIKNAMLEKDYFKNLSRSVGYGYIDEEDLLMLAIIMATGYLTSERIEFIFNVFQAKKRVTIGDFVNNYSFIWDIKDKVFSGSIWGEFVCYSRFNEDLKKQLDNFFSVILYDVFWFGAEKKKIFGNNLLKLKPTENNYIFFVDKSFSEAYNLLLAFAANNIKHINSNNLVNNPLNTKTVRFLKLYILYISENTLNFVEKLFDKVQDLDLLVTYVLEIRKYVMCGKTVSSNLQSEINHFIFIVFREADRWSDITLLLCGLQCLDAVIRRGDWDIGEEYNMNNIRLDTIMEVLQENEMNEFYIERFRGMEMRVDVLILIATEEEEKAICNNDDWEKISNGLKYSYYIHAEKEICFALARGINKGATDAAIAAQWFIDKLQPKAIAMAGFAAGRRKKVSVGDVIVPYHVFDCDAGKQLDKDTVLPEIDDYKIKDRWKQIVERFGEDWRKSIRLNVPSSYDGQFINLLHEFKDKEIISIKCIYDKIKYPNWESLITEMLEKKLLLIRKNAQLEISSKGKDYINRFDVIHPEGFIEVPPKTKVGVMATGSKVQQWDDIFNEIEKRDRNVCALEMEATAIAKISSYAEIPFIIAKGIGDYASSNKQNDNYFIEYASHSSCRFIIELFTSELMIKELKNKS